MNKLVSKNPIQRFKEGKKIQKFAGGGSSNQKFGNWLFSTGFLSPLRGMFIAAKTFSPTKASSGQIENSKNSSLQRYKAKRKEEIQKQQKQSSVKKVTKPKSVRPIQQQQQAPKIVEQPSVYIPKLEGQEDNWEEVAGIKSPILKTIREQKNQNENTSTTVTKSTTPNFGYRTDNTYENKDFGDRLKSMGIRSNADLIDFGWRTQGKDYDWKGDNWARQFRSDINQALGGDWSDANIRKVFNTAGRWGRGFLGSGDISDFQRTLQTNAGSWNGAYDKAKAQYEANNKQNTNNQITSKNYMELINKWLNGQLKLDSSVNSEYNKFLPPLFRKYPGMTIYDPIKSPLLQNEQHLAPIFRKYYKQGGQLVSRNPIQRFKLKNK